MSTQLAVIDSIKKAVMGDGLRRELELALPRQVPPARFQRVLLTSITHDNRLLAVDPGKVIRAALKIAPLGLLTDPLLGEAYLIADGRGDVQVRIGYRGLLKLARQSGEVAAIYAHEVFAKDEFTVTLGDRKALNHKPQMFGDRGDVVGYYAVVKYLNGETDFDIMTLREINGIRAKSDGYKAFKGGKIKDTPWESAYDEMAKKTVLRRLMKRVPSSPDLADALRHEAEQDDREYGGMRVVSPDQPAPPSQPLEAPVLQEIVDADGEVFLLEAGAVDAWISEQVDGATDEELRSLMENNEGNAAVREAVEACLAATDPAQDPPPPAEHAAEPASAPAEPQATRAAGSKAGKARDRFLAALAECKTLGETAELDQKLGASTALLGEHYAECAQAMQAKVDELRGGKDHHDQFADLEDPEWRGQEGGEDDRQGALV